MLYIWNFELVVISFIGALLIENTLNNFFIQRFSKEKTIKEIFDGCHKATRYATKEVEKIKKEHERLWYKKDHNIPSFISIHARNPYASSSKLHEQLPLVLTNLGAYLVSLNIKHPILLLSLIYPIENTR